MVLQSTGGILLGLSTLAGCWPQDPQGSSSIPFAPRSLPIVDDGDDPFRNTLHIPHRRALPVSDELDDNVFTLPVIHAPKPGLVGRNVEVELESRSDVAYYAQLYIGTPAQEIYLQIDTGSFELWLNPSCSDLSSSSDQKFCRATGQYDPSDSSSSSDTGDSAELNYGVGDALIDYYEDNVRLSKGGKALEGVRFGVASETEDQFAGVLGLGYGKGTNTKYMNFLDELADQGLVKSKAFSVALGSKDEGGGVLSFGGVDTGKFRGELAGLPIMSAGDSPDGVARFWVQLDSISHKGDKYSDSNMAVFLDTGATLTLLPKDLVASIADDLGSSGKDDAGFYEVDCSIVDDEDGAFEFGFDGVTVSVPYHEAIRQFSSGCYLGIAESDEFVLLGDTFLRSAYVIFDLESDTVYMAEYENCGNKLSDISKINGLDGLKGDCGPKKQDKGEEKDDKQDKESQESKETKTTKESKPEPTTSKELPVVTEESVTSTASGSAMTLTMTSTLSKPTETGGSKKDKDGDKDEDEGDDDEEASQDGATDESEEVEGEAAKVNAEEEEGEEEDAEGSAVRLTGSWLAGTVGLACMLVVL